MASSGRLFKLEQAALSSVSKPPRVYETQKEITLKEHYHELKHYAEVGVLREFIVKYIKSHPQKPAAVRATNWMLSPFQSTTAKLVTNTLLSPFVTVNQGYAEDVLAAIDLSLKGYDAGRYKKDEFPVLLEKLLILYSENVAGSISKAIDVFFVKILKLKMSDLNRDKLNHLFDQLLPPPPAKVSALNLSPSPHAIGASWMQIDHVQEKPLRAFRSSEHKREYKP